MILLLNNMMIKTHCIRPHLQTYLLITGRVYGEVFYDLQVGLDVQKVGCAFTATQLQHKLKQTQ